MSAIAEIGMQEMVPDYMTIWLFKEPLMKANLPEQMFSMIIRMIETKGLLIKKRTIVDATIIQSSHRPLSKDKRQELEENPSSQMNRETMSKGKNGKKY